MTLLRLAVAATLLLNAFTAVAAQPTPNKSLPPLEIDDRGELVLQADEFKFQTWDSKVAPEKAHIIQYFPGTMGDSKLFEPFTDSLQEHFELGTYHVTTIINLDAAMWGTSGFVVSEVKKNKRKYPMSSLVLDEEGKGLEQWELGERGAGLIILDKQGVVKHFTLEPPGADEISELVQLVKSVMES